MDCALRKDETFFLVKLSPYHLFLLRPQLQLHNFILLLILLLINVNMRNFNFLINQIVADSPTTEAYDGY